MKTICVPKDLTALNRLDYNLSEEGDLIEMDLDDEIVKKLFHTGIFEKINAIAGSNIDDFEDEKITDQKELSNVLSSEIFELMNYESQFHEVITNMKRMFQRALDMKTGVFFYF